MMGMSQPTERIVPNNKAACGNAVLQVSVRTTRCLVSWRC